MRFWLGQVLKTQQKHDHEATGDQEQADLLEITGRQGSPAGFSSMCRMGAQVILSSYWRKMWLQTDAADLGGDWDRVFLTCSWGLLMLLDHTMSSKTVASMRLLCPRGSFLRGGLLPHTPPWTRSPGPSSSGWCAAAGQPPGWRAGTGPWDSSSPRGRRLGRGESGSWGWAAPAPRGYHLLQREGGRTGHHL